MHDSDLQTTVEYSTVNSVIEQLSVLQNQLRQISYKHILSEIGDGTWPPLLPEELCDSVM